MAQATALPRDSQATGAGAPAPITTPSTSGTPGAVSALARDVAQELAPQLAHRVLDAVVHRALATVDGLSGRLESVAAGDSSMGLTAALTGKPDRAEQPDTDTNSSDTDGEGELALGVRVGAGLSQL
ncbi:MAG: hypothetical protein L0I76_24625 [Pseudonocardia sp.]|nr:hypothetical protein [Pseudonocardia sp.]